MEKEWEKLIKEAKELGLTVEEIREFLQEKSIDLYKE